MARLASKAKPKARGHKTAGALLEQLRAASKIKQKNNDVTARGKNKPRPHARPERDERDRMAMQHVVEERRERSRKSHAELDPIKRRPKR